jgi:hypothetical protein
MTVQKLLVSRNELRQMGLDYSSTHFGRLEEAGELTPIKLGHFRAARVFYRMDEVTALIAKYTRKRERRSDDS